MKNRLLLSFSLLLFLCRHSMAQHGDTTLIAVPEKIRIEVSESAEKMSLGMNNCLQVYVPGTKTDELAEDFSKFMKNYNAKGSSKKGEYFYDNAEIKQFGNNLVDIYVTTEQKAGGAELNVFFDLGGAFLNSHDHYERYLAAEDLLKKFGREAASGVIVVQLATVQKIMDTHTKEYNTLVKQDSALTKKIRDCEGIIKQAQLDQQTNRMNQDSKKKDIENNQKTMDALKETQKGIE
jgi:hypothetical protein